jgi:catechol 2,3-dioxygenase-like lactoylglutathione lyase family enzyme
MSLISRIHHVSVVVTDVERSRRFYGQVLGLREIAPPSTFDFPAFWFDLGDQHLHLIPRGEAEATSPRHFAFQVDDAGRARAHLASHGVTTRETTPIPGCDRFFIHDPDGNLIEVMQWFRPYRPEIDGARPGQAVPAPPSGRFEPAIDARSGSRHELENSGTRPRAGGLKPAIDARSVSKHELENSWTRQRAGGLKPGFMQVGDAASAEKSE